MDFCCGGPSFGSKAFPDSSVAKDGSDMIYLFAGLLLICWGFGLLCLFDVGRSGGAEKEMGFWFIFRWF